MTAPLGHRVPTQVSLGGEVRAEAADELPVFGSGHTGHLPAAILREREIVPADCAGRPSRQRPIAVSARGIEQVDDLGRTLAR